jgi:hypothetical protein
MKAMFLLGYRSFLTGVGRYWDYVRPVLLFRTKIQDLIISVFRGILRFLLVTVSFLVVVLDLDELEKVDLAIRS